MVRVSKTAEKPNKDGTSGNANNGVNESATISAIASAINADRVAKHVVTRVRALWAWMVNASCLPLRHHLSPAARIWLFLVGRYQGIELASCHHCKQAPAPNGHPHFCDEPLVYLRPVILESDRLPLVGRCLDE